MKTKTKRKIDQVADKNYGKLGKKYSLVGKGQLKKLQFLVITAFVLGVVGAIVWGFKSDLYSGSEAAGRIKNGGTATDVRAPKTPSSLIAKTISSSQINLSWSPSTDNVGVKGYNIYRSSDNSIIGTITFASTIFSDTGLTSGLTYAYYVKAFDSAGNISSQSNIASATTSEIGNACSGISVPVTDNTGIKYGTVVGFDGRCWLDRNLGAVSYPKIITGPMDANGFGWLFQWGRRADGHQYTAWGGQTGTGQPALSGISNIVSKTSVVASPDDVKFIAPPLNVGNSWLSLSNAADYANLWAGAMENNPCPSGFRVPLQAEWDKYASASGLKSCTDCIMSSYSTALKLTAAGIRFLNGDVAKLENGAGYWAGDPSGGQGYMISIGSDSIRLMSYASRGYGYPVRCIRN